MTRLRINPTRNTTAMATAINAKEIRSPLIFMGRDDSGRAMAAGNYWLSSVEPIHLSDAWQPSLVSRWPNWSREDCRLLSQRL